MQTTSSRLKKKLESLSERITTLIGGLSVKHYDWNSDAFVVIGFPNYGWGELSSIQVSDQIGIKRDYCAWFDMLQAAFSAAPKHLEQRIAETDKEVRCWIELESNFSIRPDPETNKKALQDLFHQYFEILKVLEASQTNETLLVPDTNAFISEPDPTKYRPIAGSDRFVFLILPTVLVELDSLKNSHHKQELKEKAKKAITRIKGWRNQGSLPEGVKVDHTITVKTLAVEGRMNKSLSWLDRHNQDDRIIASILEVQSLHPSSQVILVTGDINMMNKADFAQIETCELNQMAV